MEAMKKGCMLFPNYCRSRGIDQNGNHTRKLEKLDPKFKEDLTPENKKPTWAINVEEADKIFIGGEKDG